jgi:hypothetical protein
VGLAEEIDGVSGTSLSDPAYTSVIGILLLAQKYGVARKQFKLNLSF